MRAPLVQVRWKGYSAAPDTWELRENINTAAFQDFALGKDKYPNGVSLEAALSTPDTEPGHLLKSGALHAAELSPVDAPGRKRTP